MKRRTITIELPSGDTLSNEAFFDMQEAVAKAVKRHMKGQIGRALMRVQGKGQELTTERWLR